MKKLLLLCALAFLACDPDAGGADGGPQDGGNHGHTDGGNTGTDGGNCTPLTCEDTAGCGSYDDGCGGTVNCTDQCECTESNFETACESKACEALVGCSPQGTCEYAPVRCGSLACAPADATHCAGGGCEGLCTGAGCTAGLYPCGDGVCATVTQYCDPNPTVVEGKAVYANTCVGAPETGCGTCNLGVRACDSGNDRFVCNEPPNPVTANGGTVECDSTLAGSTYVYLDTAYTGGANDGSKARPFTNYASALSDAQSRNARGIVIAGSPTFLSPLTVSNGISLYGGFDGAPSFNPNRQHRPVWDIAASHYDSGTNQLVGGQAIDITNGTVLFHIEIKTQAVNQRDANGLGASNVALLARNAPQLALEDVILRAGHAASGQSGSPGADAGPAERGGDATGRVPGNSGATCAATCTLNSGDPGYVAGQGNQACGYGGHMTDPARTWSFYALKGNPGSNSNVPQGGTAGNTEYDSSNCGLSKDDVTAGGTGGTGSTGSVGPNGAKGSVAGVDGNGIYRPNPGSNGGAGGRGSWGGGGGGGGTFDDGCIDTEPGDRGGFGGGGGGPGCGGAPGQRGLGGGASIALVAASSTGLAVRNSTLQAGDGGAGGSGGHGGTGGQGGTGADGTCPTNQHSGSKCGGRGGNGGPGGVGGNAGGGSGGHSVGIWCVSTTALPLEANTISTGGAGTGGSAAQAPLRGDSGAAAQTQGCP